MSERHFFWLGDIPEREEARRKWGMVPGNVPSGKASETQIGGDHYAKLAIQPFEYITANSIPYAEGCAIKYLTRWRDKGGIEDLRKASHFIDMLIEREERHAD
jgi:hypothetical protein